MNEFIENTVRKVKTKRHYLIADQWDVLNILNVFDTHRAWYINENLHVGQCGWIKDESKWFVHFTVSEEQWTSIVNDLNEAGFELVIKSNRTELIYVLKKD